MTQRKETTRTFTLEDGTAIVGKLLDGLLIEDLMILHMNARAFTLITGEAKTAQIGRDVKNGLIRLYSLN
jgi:hypothetical protein